MRSSRLRKLFLVGCLAAVSLAGLSAFPQAPPPSQKQPSPADPSARQEWFFSQRRYGLGYIPEDALPKAVAQRDAMTRRTRFTTQSSADGAAISATQWSSLGPAGITQPSGSLLSGRITSLAIDPTNPSTVYVAAAGGGVWKSTNHGARWDPVTDNLPSLASGVVAVDPFSGEVWYGTGELNFCRDCYYGAGVYRSADGGAHWTRVGADTFLSSPTSAIAFDRRNKGTLLIGRSSALWKSSDGGATWRTVLRGVVTDVVFNPLDSNIIYAALGNFSGAPANGIYRSSDNGETWTLLSAGLPPQSTIGRIALAAAPSAPATLYALIAKSSDFNLNGLYRSLDGGNTWTLLGSAPANLFLEDDGSGQGNFDICVQVDPADAATIYLGGIDLWKSSDNGASWQDLSETGGLHEDQHGIVFDPSSPRAFYVISDGGVWWSPDAGQSFTNLNATLSITQFYTVGLHPTSPNLAVGGTQDNGVVLYHGSFAWDQGVSGDSGFAFYNSANAQTIYASANHLSLRRSDDGGKTFLPISAGLDPSDRVLFFPPLLPVPSQPGALYFATQRIWHSSDHGDHWTAISGDLTRGGSAAISTLAMAPSSPQMLYAGTSDAQIEVSSDGGRTWSPAAALPNRFISSIAVHPQNFLRVIVGLSGFGSGHVFQTDDRGGSWRDISGNLPDIPVNAVLIDALSPDRVYIGTDIGVFVLAPDGTWSPLNQGMPNAIVLGLSQNPVTGLLVAATHGRGVFGLAQGDPALKAPHLNSIVSSATLAQTSLAPGMSVSLLGSNLGSAAVAPPLPSSLPFSMGGTIVFINGVAAPQFSVAPDQVNFLVPYGITGPTVEVTLMNGGGQATVRASRADVSPGIFQTGADGNISHANGARVSDAAPARASEELVLYATGLGEVDQVVNAGDPAPSAPAAKTLIQPAVRVGGVPANVVFSGLTPGLIGTYQINFVVPPGLTGRVPVALTIGGVTSNTVLMTAGQ